MTSKEKLKDIKALINEIYSDCSEDNQIKSKNVFLQYCDDIEKELTQQPTPAFFECVKEWNQKGWTVDIHKREITISDTKSLKEISIDRKDNTCWCSHYLSFELHYLLTKTIKTLEAKDA